MQKQVIAFNRKKFENSFFTTGKASMQWFLYLENGEKILDKKTYGECVINIFMEIL